VLPGWSVATGHGVETQRGTELLMYPANRLLYGNIMQESADL
jgi:hypothetical protein